jgi:hypothetical protein
MTSIGHIRKLTAKNNEDLPLRRIVEGICDAEPAVVRTRSFATASIIRVLVAKERDVCRRTISAAPSPAA